jgi:hypothetical protein
MREIDPMTSLNENDLPAFGECFLQVYDPQTKSFELRRKSHVEGSLSLREAMELIAKLLRRYQMAFVPHKTEGNLVFFPFMFVEPQEGDKIRNMTTGEIYTVDQILKNPDTGTWDGLLRLDLTNPPSIEDLHTLEHLDHSRYVNFDHELPRALPNQVGANMERILSNLPPMFPTVTWSVVRTEPGSLGRPFDSRKEFKPHLRESTKDPYVNGYTVEVWGQWFDNLVQFNSWSNDLRTSERLVNWFGQFMKLYAGYIRNCGVVQLFFWRRDQDDVKTTWRQAFSVRSTQYYFRTEELSAEYQRDLLRLNIVLGTDTQSEVNRRFNETRYIADQKVTGSLTPDEYRALFYRSGQFLFGDVDILQ